MELFYETSLKPRVIVAACRQTAAFLRKIELSGFLPKAATPVLQKSQSLQWF
jgi:hypothetical protein